METWPRCRAPSVPCATGDHQLPRLLPSLDPHILIRGAAEPGGEDRFSPHAPLLSSQIPGQRLRTNDG